VVEGRLVTAAAAYDLIARSPTDVSVRQVAAGGVRAWPGGAWGAALVEEAGAVAIRAGAVGDDGVVNGGALSPAATTRRSSWWPRSATAISA
jgi:hypothetical protein